MRRCPPFGPFLVLAAAASLVLASGARAQGDDCSTPTPISGEGDFAYDTTGASSSSFDGGNPVVCWTLNDLFDVFFAWTATQDGDYRFDPGFVGSIVNSEMLVYAGGDCSATCLSAGQGQTLGPVLLTGVQTGDTYLIQIGGDWSLNPFADELSIRMVEPTPAQDDCAFPQVISGLGSFPVDTSSATTSGFDGGSVACQFAWGVVDLDVFLAWTVPADGDYRFDACDGIHPNSVFLHAGSDCSATCVGSPQIAGCLQGEFPSVLFGAQAGDPILVQVGSAYSYEPGTVHESILQITQAAPPVDHDTCDDPDPIAGWGTFPFDATGATGSGFQGGVATCAATPSFSTMRDVFFEWTASDAGTVRFDTLGTAAPIDLLVYRGNDCSAACLGQGDGGNFDALEVPGVLSGDVFLLQLSVWSNSTQGFDGSLNVHRAFNGQVPDDCASATPLPYDIGQDGGTFVWTSEGASTSMFDDQCFASNAGVVLMGNDIFHQWFPRPNTTYRISTEHSPGGQQGGLRLYEGTDCNAECLTPGSFLTLPPAIVEITTGPCAGPGHLIQLSTFQTQPLGRLTIEVLTPATHQWSVGCEPAGTHYLGQAVELCVVQDITAESQVTLSPRGGPTGSFGFFLGAASVGTGIALGGGTLCLELPIGRYQTHAANALGLPQLNSIGRFDAFGSFENLSGTGGADGHGFALPMALPLGPGATLAPGDTWHVQLWYRDQISGPWDSSNLSHSVEIQIP